MPGESLGGRLDETSIRTIAIENAGRTAAMRAAVGAAPGTRFAVTVGALDAGAAALVAARHLANWGFPVQAFHAGMRDMLSPAARREARVLEACGVSAEPLLSGALAREKLAAVEAPRALTGFEVSEPTGRAEEVAAAARERFSGALTVECGLKVRPPAPRPEDFVFRPEVAPCSREEVRMLDSLAIRELGMPGLSLMENAGYYAAREAFALLGGADDECVVVFAGRGNNGGDGFVIARLLAWWDVADVRVVLLGEADQVMDDARANLDYLDAAAVPWEEAASEEAATRAVRDAAGAGLVVDAVLGTGLSGAVRGSAAAFIDALNCAGARAILAVDTPSGLDANTGEPLGAAVHASVTVTFAAAKAGFFSGRGREHTGRLVVADIGLPRSLYGTV